MHDVTTLDLSRIAQDLQIRKTQVESVVQLLDEGNTVPLIVRYRKERTGGLGEEVVRQIQSRVNFQRQLADRKQTILKSIEGQGKLNDVLGAAIVAADTSKRLEDLYLPYKPKKRSLAAGAREKGLEPLARAIWNNDPAVANLAEQWSSFVNPDKQLNSPEDVQTGVQQILAEIIAETAEVRAATRCHLWETGKICASKSDKLAEGQGLDFKDYFDFHESLRHIPPHRILALNRGEKENALKARLEFNAENIKSTAAKALAEHLFKASPPPAPNSGATAVTESGQDGDGELLSPGAPYKTPHAGCLRTVLDQALTRILLPSLEREIRRELTDEAEAHAIMVFGRNLRSLLLQPPSRGKRVLAVDPGFRAGCKVVALDEDGHCLEDAVIHPHPLREREKKTPKPPPAAAPAAAPAEPAVKVEAALSPAPEAAASAPEPAATTAAVDPVPAEAVTSPTQAAALPDDTAGLPPTVDIQTVPTPPHTSTPSPTVDGPVASAAKETANKREEAKAKLHDLVTRLNLHVIAIGNGTACRETEEFISELIHDKLPDLAYVIVNEAGATVYSASSIGREEFPDHDAAARCTVTIGRRLQDPLSELVKVDPQSIGVGLYQHDVNSRHLKESLEGIIESCVNHVGVDLNSASVPLLRHVSGLNQMVARDIIEFRKRSGPFKRRDQLLEVPSVGPARYVQAAGFLRIPSGENPLDRTWIHPESYGLAARLLSDLGFGPESLDDSTRQEELRQKLRKLNVEEAAIQLQAGVQTLRDIVDALMRPGRDPRDDLPAPVLKKGVLRIEDLRPGMELKGTVLNVVDFGAFVDIGLKDSGLVHISQMANRYVKSPYEVVAVSDVVKVWVLNVDQERHRVSLTMIAPGTERKPPEKRPPLPPQQTNAGDPGQQQTRGGRGRSRGRPPEQSGGRPTGGRPGGARYGHRPQQGGPPSQGTPAAAGEGAAAAGGSATAKPPPPRRRTGREPPRPKLSQAALEGKTPLRTFAELGALFAAKKAPPPPPVATAAPEPEPAVKAETDPPPVEQPAEAESSLTSDSSTPPQQG